MRPIDKIPTKPLDSSEIKIGRLQRRIEKLKVQLASRDKKLETHNEIFKYYPSIQRSHQSYTERLKEHQRVKDLETRVKEQAALIALLQK